MISTLKTDRGSDISDIFLFDPDMKANGHGRYGAEGLGGSIVVTKYHS